MTDDERQYLTTKLAEKFDWFNKGSRFWSAVHHWGLGISGGISAFTVVVVKINWIKELLPLDSANRDDVIAVLAALATLITTVSVAGSFGRKWQTNRISRGRIERLQVALSDPAANAVAIRDELQDIIKKHDEGIIGTPIK